MAKAKNNKQNGHGLPHQPPDLKPDEIVEHEAEPPDRKKMARSAKAMADSHRLDDSYLSPVYKKHETPLDTAGARIMHAAVYIPPHLKLPAALELPGPPSHTDPLLPVHRCMRRESEPLERFIIRFRRRLMDSLHRLYHK